MANTSQTIALVLSSVVFILAVVTPAQAATFTEIDFDAGQALSEAQGPIAISSGVEIEGSLFSPRDVDLYQLQLDLDASIKVSANSETSDLNLYLFDEAGRGIKSAASKLSFSGAAGDTFYLGVNGTAALNEQEAVLLDPTRPNCVGSGTLGGWTVPDVAIQVVIPYAIAFEVQSIELMTNER